MVTYIATLLGLAQNSESQSLTIKNAHLVEKDIQMTMHRELEPHGKSADDRILQDTRYSEERWR
jgi:hypothetical protein